MNPFTAVIKTTLH